MTLVDSSVWIRVFRKGGPRIEELVPMDDIVTCLPVVQEVLQGFSDERAYRIARSAMYSFQIVESPLEASLFDEAVELFRTARRAGLTVRSSVDCLIAACALRHDLEVLHDDRDFSALRQVCQLKERRIR